jgi:RNA polymerase sigma-70 factor (ECF subfamily)
LSLKVGEHKSATSEDPNIGGRRVEVCKAPTPRSNLADGDLVRRLRERPEIVFPDFVERYQSAVYRIACGIVGHRDDADVIAQQVFVKAYSSIRSFDGRSSLCAWVYRMTVNECYAFLRRRRKSLQTASRADRQAALDDRIGPRRDVLNQSLDGIAEDERYLLLLRELEDYSIAELADATGLRESAIKAKLLRARQALACSARHAEPTVIGSL